MFENLPGVLLRRRRRRRRRRREEEFCVGSKVNIAVNWFRLIDIIG